MTQSAYEFRSLKARSLWLPLSAIALFFGGGIYLGHAAQGWLIGMSIAVIAVVAEAFADALREPRYWLALGIFAAVHLVILAFATEAWIPKPTQAITPIFLFDYMAMGFAFPKVSGLKFDGL